MPATQPHGPAPLRSGTSGGTGGCWAISTVIEVVAAGSPAFATAAVSVP